MKLGRHRGVEVDCQQCGNSFIALAQRIEQGLGKFCSKECFDNWQRENRKSDKWGKENAKAYPKAGGGYFVQWYQENGKPKNMPWHNWAWEINFGEIPNGYVVEYKDGNKNNIILDNLQLRLTRKGKQALPKKKKVLSLEHRNKISLRLVQSWKNGVFDVHRGSNNPNWKPKHTRHPKEFSKALREFIRERDSHICQICGNDLTGRRQPVHHIDGNKFHNESDNLILVCSSCHTKIHLNAGKSSPIIMAFRDKLLE